MLTTIPEEEFLQLCEINEANASKKAFEYETMLKHSKTRQDINKYMASTNVKLIGTGSSRTAYFLPEGKYGKSSLETPACFKVANNEAGVSQNKVETNAIKKFSGDKYPCFPKLYESDKKNLFMLCEVGTPADKAKKISSDYFKDWKAFGMKYTRKNKSIYKKMYEGFYTGERELNRRLFAPENINDLIDRFGEWCDTFSVCIAHKYDEKTDKRIALAAMQNFWSELAKAHPKYAGIVSTYDFLINNSGVVEPGDFSFLSNWGFVKRGEDVVLIPIDWGFDTKTARKYYNYKK